MPSATVRVTFFRRAPLSLFALAMMPIQIQDLLADRFPRALTGAGVGFGALTAQRQAATMTDATVAAQIHQPLDIHVGFPTQVALRGNLGNLRTDRVQL